MLSSVELKDIAKRCRDNAIVMAEAAGSGHLGGSFSIMDTLVALKFKVMTKDDVLVYSKAHCSEALYAVLCEAGEISKEELKTFCEWGSRLQSHTEHWALKTVDFSGGSLGQGLSYACGIALAKKLKGDVGRVFCIIGDGECQEGQIWEAAMFAIDYDLFNLIVIVDCNNHSAHSDKINGGLNRYALYEKFREFGWLSVFGDDTSIDKLSDFLGSEKLNIAFPTAVLLNTVKGKGVKLWEMGCSHLQYGKELEEGIKEWRSNGT